MQTVPRPVAAKQCVDTLAFQTPNTKAILHEYNHRRTLTPQDVVKCFLRIYSAYVSPAYDCRENLWNARPGDVIYIDGSFVPLLSRFSIDEGDKQWKCIHVKEREIIGNNRLGTRHGQASYNSRPCDRQCRKWYACYRKETGGPGLYYPEFDGVTIIYREEIERILKLLKHRDRRMLRRHFLESPARHFGALFSEVQQHKFHFIDNTGVLKGQVEPSGRISKKQTASTATTL